MRYNQRSKVQFFSDPAREKPKTFMLFCIFCTCSLFIGEIVFELSCLTICNQIQVVCLHNAFSGLAENGAKMLNLCRGSKERQFFAF